jgi:MoxR-like ATPase
MLRASSRRPVRPCIAPSDVTRLRTFIRDTVVVEDSLIDYIVRLGRASRNPAEVGRADMADLLTAGISPRSYQHLLALARVTAFLHGRAYVRPSDVKEIFLDATRHRVIRSLRAEAENVSVDAILEALLRRVPLL